jgi:Peptidase family C25
MKLKLTSYLTLFVCLSAFAQTKKSALSDGDIYKIAVKETGMTRLDYAFLKNELKISNLDQIDPRTIKVLGNGGGILPESNAISRADDVWENAIFVEGEADGKFDAGDYILFYAVGADRWQFNRSDLTYSRPKNIYSDAAYYFVKIGSGNGKRVSTPPSVSTPVFTSTTFNNYGRFEEDKVNLLAGNPLNNTPGGGKDWFGDAFNQNLERTYSDKFGFTNVALDTVTVRSRMAASSPNFSKFSVTVGTETASNTISSVVFSGPDDTYATDAYINHRFVAKTADPLAVKVKYEDGNRAWLDFVEINCRQKLSFTSPQMSFRDTRTLGKSISRFQLENANTNVQIWEVSDVQNVQSQSLTLSGATASFNANTEGGIPREFVAFDKSQNGNFQKPVAVGKINNQNLHAFDNIDVLIVYHKEFEAAAKKLANHRRQVSGYQVEIAEIAQVYNEFSSGALDPAAIRDMARMLWKRNPTKFKYLLLLGDGSFDYKRIYPLGTLTPSDFIPSYQNFDSFDALNAFPSDDFFALLGDTEGVNLAGDLDIGVGRIPCKTAREANDVVEKLIRYDSPKAFGDWRNRVVFSADNGDYSLHQDQADGIANSVFNRYRNLNLEKLYVDAFKLDVSAGGTRVPQLNEAMNQAQFNGFLAYCYLGHGGSKGLAQERILMNEDLQSWRNTNRLPLLITATCSFTGFDQYKEVSAGESALLNPLGGAIALFSTTRAVFANSNEDLTKAVFNQIFEKKSGLPQTVGGILQRAKNASNTGGNGNKFALFGDPSMRLALPRYDVATTKINGKTASAANKDTVRALQKVTVEGTILGDNGAILTDFNGTIFPTVYDKVLTLKTLGQTIGNDISYARDYTLQRNIIFKGAASVKNGIWKFSFIVPKDIDYTFGAGKISYYATDSLTVDASGSYEGFSVGGTDPSVVTDNKPPKVEVFIENWDWKTGNTITNRNPIALVRISDDNGINIAGTSIGHDLTGTLNEARNPLILNNFYEAAKDDPSTGYVRYPLSNLAVGTYQLRVKAWDVSNNAGEGTTEFIVAENASNALQNVLAYPNPASSLVNFKFEHNLSGSNYTAKVEVFSLTGQLIGSINQAVSPINNIVEGLQWTAPPTLASGFYTFRITLSAKDVKNKTQSVLSKFEKLVLIK